MIPPDLSKSHIRTLMNRVGGSILFYLLFSFIVSLLVGILSIVLRYVMLTMNGTPDVEVYNALLENIEEDSLLNALLLLISPFIALVVAFLGSSLSRIKLRPLLKPTSLNASTFTVVTLIILGVSCAASYLIYPIDAIFSFFNLTAQLPDFLQTPVDQPLYMVLYVIAICIGAPFAEELLFRGVILHGLKPYGNSFAVLISALFFGLIHGNFAQGPGAFLIGIALGVVTLRTGSLLPAILIHAINNTLSVFVGYLVEVTNLSDTFILVVDAVIVITAILLTPIGWSKVKDFWRVMHVPPDDVGMNMLTTARTVSDNSARTIADNSTRIVADNNMGMGTSMGNSTGFPEETPLQTGLSTGPPIQEGCLDNKASFTSGPYLKNEDSPFWHRRWYSFWTSWTMLIALISCIALLLIGGVQPL